MRGRVNVCPPQMDSLGDEPSQWGVPDSALLLGVNSTYDMTSKVV